MVKVNCNYCGKETEKKPSRAIGKNYCSSACYNAHRRKDPQISPSWKGGLIECICLICGATFHRKPKDVRNGANKTCSRACQGKWQSLHRSGENHPSWREERLHLNCAFCKKEIVRLPSDMTKSKKAYCNFGCLGKHRKTLMRGQGNHNWKRGQVSRKCANCQKLFKKMPCQLKGKTRRFCSMKCKNDFHSKEMWRGGTVRSRGDNWKQQAESARKRDNYTCQDCGISQVAHIEKTGFRLSVHHIKPFVAFGWARGENDNYLIANDLANLITLCHSCHRKMEAKNE